MRILQNKLQHNKTISCLWSIRQNRRVSQIFIEKALMATINIQGRDEALDFTFVKDTANGFVLSAINPRINNQIFNVTYGKAQSL